MSLGSVASSYKRPYWNINNGLPGYGSAATIADGPSYQAAYGSLNKYSPKGTQIWRKIVGGLSMTYCMCLDSSENIYLGGVNASNKAAVVKLDSNGNVLMSVTLGDGIIYSIDTDASGNIYAAGYAVISSLNYAIALKLNSSGVLQWSIRNNTSTTYYNGVCYEPYGGYVGLAGTNFNSGTGVGMILLLDASSGSISWQKNVTQNSGHSGCQSIAADFGGYLYVETFSNGVGNFSALKFSNGGTYQWGTSFLPGSSGLVAYGGIAADFSSNCYLTNYDGQYIKVNSAGSGIFQRQITLNGISAIGGSGISLGSEDVSYLTATIPSFLGGISKVTSSTTNPGLGTYSWGSYTASAISESSYSGSISTSGYSFTTGSISATSFSPTITTTYPTPEINRITT